MREQFTVVALPYSCSPDDPYHVSLFVSPDIEVDDPRDTLAVSIAEPKLEPGASTTAFVVGANGETGHD